MEVARGMYMVQTGHNLPEDGRDKASSECAPLPRFDEVVEISFHGLENEVQLLGIRQEEEVVEGNNVRMEGYCT